MTQVFIAAAGKAQRFSWTRKQLLMVNGTVPSERLLDRIIRQVRERDGAPVTLAVDDAITGAVWENKCNLIKPHNHDTLCNTILESAFSWKNRNIILLGDVIYSKSTMDRIFNCKRPIAVFGTTWDIFAVSFSVDVVDRWIAALEKGALYRLGKLRYAYKYYIGVHPDAKEDENQPLDHVVFQKVDDYTCDVDTEYEYNQYLKEVVQAGRLDDLP